ncbi:hypothetical protein KJ652_03945 [Patescibacteria group bacterium]|nr:hypothetical protein [Patescibacteria group bacterium]MBU1123717.1 hypothetical protein [Patescibacteria group bacterium]MBU1911420.1 hypothetical protein [Patescibacteria group bacterium]
MTDTFFNSIKTYLEPWLLFLAEDPILRAGQLSLMVVGFLAIFLVFFTTRDIILRTNSFFLMLFCILIVALLPGVGFLIYLLIRPSRTLKEKELENLVNDLIQEVVGKKLNRSKKKVIKV